MDQIPQNPTTPDPQLSDYVRQARAASVSDEEIRKELTESGWPDEDMRLAMERVIPSQAIPQDVPRITPESASLWFRRPLIRWIAGIFLTGCTALVLYVIFSTEIHAFIVSHWDCRKAADRDQCVVDAAPQRMVLAQSMYLCDHLGAEEKRDHCYTLVAETKAAPEFCEKVVDEPTRDRCFAADAKKRADPALCLKVKDASRLDECYRLTATLASDPVACGLVKNGELADACFGDVAKAKKDAAICERITADAVHDACLLDLNKDSKDITLCLKVKDASRGDECYRLTATLTNDPASCGLVKNRDLADTCFADVAKAKKDAAICESITADEAHDACLTDLIKDSKDVTQCSGIRDDKTQDTCFFDYLTAQTAPEVCEKFPAPVQRSKCYNSLASSRKDPDLCWKVQPTYVPKCLQDVAIAARMASYCDLSASGWIQSCYEAVGKGTKDYKICTAAKDKTAESNITACTIGVSLGILDEAVAKNNDGMCARLPSQIVVNNCLTNVAAKNKRPELCRKTFLQADLLVQCIQEIAIQNKDSSYCKSLDKNRANGCVSIAAQRTGDKSLCANIVVKPEMDWYNQAYCENGVTAEIARASVQQGGDPNQCAPITQGADRYFCYLNAARYRRDPSLCNNITNPAGSGLAINDCIAEVAGNAMDEKMCNVISAAGDKDKCVYAVVKRKIAVNQAEPAACLKLVNSLRDCLQNAAVVRKDPGICQLNSTQSDRDWCVSFVVGVLHEPSACEAIVDESLKRGCQTYY